MVKFLIISFNSLGDILLTTPVIRGLKQQVEDAEVHFLTVPSNHDGLKHNPYLSKIHLLEDDLDACIDAIIPEDYDYLIDLNEGWHSNKIKQKLPITAFTYDHLNFKTWLLVNFKINRLPALHIVDRYMDTVSIFDVENDGKGLDFFYPEEEKVEAKSLHSAFEGKFMVVVLDVAFFTRQIPIDKLVTIINMSGMPVCIIGNQDQEKYGRSIEEKLKVPLLNTVGKFDLYKMASLIEQCTLVLTPDSDMLQLTSAFNKPILSLWGNTIPAFGKSEYLPHEQSATFEVNHLRCRPCTKNGYSKCPKRHHKCMTDIDNAAVVNKISEIIK